MEREKREAAARKTTAASNPNAPKPTPLVENLNRLSQPDEEVRSVDEALKMFRMEEKGAFGGGDRHPERRAKQAYATFEASRLPKLKSENPSLRHTQLKQILYNEWQKSPDNPLNQEHLAYNTK